MPIFENSLQVWDEMDASWREVADGIAEPENLWPEEEWLPNSNTIVRMTAPDKEFDWIDVPSTGVSKFVQANESYAVWVDEKNQIRVYDYDSGDYFALRKAGEEGWEIRLFGQYLVYKGAKIAFLV